MAVSRAVLEVLFSRGEDLGELLPYGFHDRSAGVYMGVDGAMGAIFELTPCASESETEEIRNEAVAKAERFFADIPSGVDAQFIIVSSGHVDEDVDAYEAGTDTDNKIVRALVDNRMARHQRAVREGFVPGDPMRARSVRYYFTLRYGKREIEGGWSRVLGMVRSGSYHRDKVDRRHDEVKEVFQRWVETVRRGLDWLGLDPRPVGPSALLRLLDIILNPNLSYQRPLDGRTPFDPELPLRHQVCREVYEVAGGRILTGAEQGTEGRKVIKAFSLTGLPSQVRPGMIQDLIERIPYDFVATLNFRVEDSLDAIQGLDVARFFLGRHSRGMLGQENFGARATLEEIEEVSTEVHSQGRRLIKFALHVVAVGKASQEARIEDEVGQAFRSLMGTATVERIVCLPVLLSSLPLGFDAALDTSLRRLRTVLSDRFACLTPVWGCWRGMNNRVAAYVNRLGEMVGFDLFGADGAPHAMILGGTGKGKSFMMQDLILQTFRHRDKPYFFVIDMMGGSYRKLCEVLGGRYIEVDLKKPVRMNLFAGEYSEDQAAYWTNLLYLMVKDQGAKGPMSHEVRAVLTDGVRSAFAGKGGEEVFLSDVADALRSLGDLGAGLALRLRPFLRGVGVFGEIFDGPSTLPTGDLPRFTVFDLTGAKEHKDLHAPLLGAVIQQIQRLVSGPALRGVRKIIPMDEGWAALKDDAGEEFAREAWKTFRKMYAAVLFMTQDMEDVAKSAAGQAIINNSSTFIIFQHRDEAFSSLKSGLNLSDARTNLVRSLQWKKGYFSEVYVKTAHGGRTVDTVLRVIPDGFSYWMFTMDGDDLKVLDEKQRSAGNLLAAIEALSKEKPHGAKAA
ncbi:MAG: TraC family protein [Nitrospirae bacterium]|nr:TraC family protein [Nitrospirota bacterium]